MDLAAADLPPSLAVDDASGSKVKVNQATQNSPDAHERCRMPPNFDFITDKSIRHSLENDHKEMANSFREGNNKCAVIMAGSIVEALLIDYLRAYPNQARKMTKSDPLQIGLAEAVEVSHAEGIIDGSTKDLCTVIRSFRNLIHPGLLVRKGEPLPDQDTAQICVALVNKIVRQLEVALRARRGLTAEQVVSKIERDTHAIGLVQHLLQDMQEPERERLLLEVLPVVYTRAFVEGREAFAEDPEHADDHVVDLQSLFHTAFQGAMAETQAKVANKFVEVLKTGDTEAVTIHTRDLFRAPYLVHVAAKDHLLVTSHLLTLVGASHTSMRSLEITKGICPFLRVEQIDAWLDPLVKAILIDGAAGPHKQPEVVNEAMAQIYTCGWVGKGTVPDDVQERLARWSKSLRANGRSDLASKIEIVHGAYTVL